MDRRDFFKKGWKQALGGVMRSPVGSVIDRQLHSFSNLLAPQWLHERMIQEQPNQDDDEAIWGSERPGASAKSRAKTGGDSAGHPPGDRLTTHDSYTPHYSRPPGALPTEKAFQKACTRCNDCIVACPHGVIFNLGPFSGPVLETNTFPCHLCEDFPCIKSCDEGALKPLPEDTLPWFGTAILIEDHCLNFATNRQSSGRARKRSPYCKACASRCPVDAIHFGKDRMPDIAEHCTGCGLCVQDCPVDPAALRILW